ncbi:signal-transducing adaptor protein 2 isoform X2 [Carassius auratus]|uniref:Signal-transducing adaptor protein 2 isoform X2 n=1 Tax=Carassius auratus TaxID=7957 RepID=A0A6P6JQB8_CARAU|nr:signal-transducing adaptor protein 2-like isoform X2 [Carassius auratus]
MRVSDEINHAYPVPSISRPKKACRFPVSSIIQRLFVPLPCLSVCVCVCVFKCVSVTLPGRAARVMAVAPANPRTGSTRAQLPPCYYEGYLEKRGAKEKVARRLWTCLCGNTLYFFNNPKDTNYVEKLDLSGFVSLIDDPSRDRNLEAARLNLRMKDGEIKLTAPNLEARELWKGFLYSVVDLAVPTTLTLLPGQLHMLKEVVEKEKMRRKARASSRAPSSPLSLPLVGEIPACFRPVSRTEAEVLLERHPDCGNMLLRPGRDGSSLAVTTRQDLNGSVFRHYRVTQKQQGGYIIDVENPVCENDFLNKENLCESNNLRKISLLILFFRLFLQIPCPTLHDVINALVEKTAGTLQPFILEEPYEENITFVSSNDENGERTLHCAPSGPLSRAPSLPPKQVSTDRWSLRSQTRSPSSSPKSFSPSGSPSNSMRRLVLSPSPLSQSLTDELKQKLEKRQTSQE